MNEDEKDCDDDLVLSCEVLNDAVSQQRNTLQNGEGYIDGMPSLTDLTGMKNKVVFGYLSTLPTSKYVGVRTELISS